MHFILLIVGEYSRVGRFFGKAEVLVAPVTGQYVFFDQRLTPLAKPAAARSLHFKRKTCPTNFPSLRKKFPHFGHKYSETSRATAAETYRQTLATAKPKLNLALLQLKAKYAANQAQLEGWGLDTVARHC